MYVNTISRWFVYKHAKPLPEEIVRFQPYTETDDFYRGTTVLPYLESFYQYGENNMDRGATTVDEGGVVCVCVCVCVLQLHHACHAICAYRIAGNYSRVKIFAVVRL